MTRNADPFNNLADALAEDIVAAPAAALMHDASSDPGGAHGFVAAFDRIAARAGAQARRRLIAERLRALLNAVVPPLSWTSAMAAVASLGVVVVAGGIYVHQDSYRTAAVPPPIVLADQVPEKAAPRMLPARPMSYGDNRVADANSEAAAAPQSPPPAPAAAAQPAPQPPFAPSSVAVPPHIAAAPAAAAPPVAAVAPPPAPPAAAGGVDAPKAMRTVKIDSDAQPASGAAAPAQPRILSGEMLERALRDYQVATAIAAQGNNAEARTRSSSFGGTGLASSYAPPGAVRYGARNREAAPSFQWPLRGRLIAPFGSPVGGVPNTGIDLAAPRGTDVRAADEGVVAYAGDFDTFGKLILLSHRGGFITVYAHAQSIRVKTGDTVRRGQVIAKSGQSGSASAPQLHFEIRKGETAVDPKQYLPPG
jgi:murein DD-endopeptidase MepM/ murein hydrolase activator NlpD